MNSDDRHPSPRSGTAHDGKHPELDRLLRTLPPEEAYALREVWELAGDRDPDPFPDAATQANDARRLAAAVRTSASHAAGVPAGRRFRRHTRILAAAASLVILVGGYLALRPTEISAPLGERLSLSLPDGSTVELNSGSAIRYRRSPGWWLPGARSVHLIGEAYFAVVPMSRPFTVSTHDARIHVLGTRFVVRSWPGDGHPSTSVTVESGAVRFSRIEKGSTSVILEPGSTWRTADPASGDDSGIERVDVSAEEAMAWRAGDFIFTNASVESLLRELERRYAIRIDASSVTLSGRTMSVALRQPQSASSIIADLATALGVRYRKTAIGFELTADSSEP